MSAGTSPGSISSHSLLQQCRRRILFYSIGRGLADTVLVLMCCTLVACLLDWMFPLPGLLRLLLLIGTVLVTGNVCRDRLIRPLVRPMATLEIGAAMDLAIPELNEGLATLLSLEQTAGDSSAAGLSESGSVVLQRRLRGQVEKVLRRVKPSDVIRPGTGSGRWGVVAITLLLAAIPVVFWTSGTWLLLLRLMLPMGNIETASNLYFEIPDAERTVARGLDVTVAAIPRWRTSAPGTLPAAVHIELSAEGRQERLAMSYDEGQARYLADLSGLQQATDYRIVGGSAATAWFRLNVADPPAVLNARMTVIPPAYTGRATEVVEGVVGEIVVFERSELQIALEFSKPVRQAVISWKNWKPVRSAQVQSAPAEAGSADELPSADQTLKDDATESLKVPGVLSADRKSAEFSLQALGSGDFEFIVVDDDNLSSLSEPDRRLTIVEDLPPQLTVTGIRNGQELKPTDILALDCVAADDTGISLLEVYLQKNQEQESHRSLNAIPPSTLKIQHAFRIPLQSLDLMSGDTLAVRVKLADNRPMPEPQVVWKGPWVIQLNLQAEEPGAKELREEDRQLIDELKAAEQQLQQDEAAISRLKEQLFQQWDQPARDSAIQISEKEQVLGNRLQRLSSQAAEHPLMKHLADGLQQVGAQLRQEIAQTMKSAAQKEREGAAGELQNAILKLTAVRTQLQKLIEDIEQAAGLEQDLTALNRLALEAEELAENAQKLEDARRQKDASQVEQEQQKLNQERERLTEELAELLAKHDELLKSAQESQQNQLSSLADQSQQLAETQKQLADGIRESLKPSPAQSAEQKTDSENSKESITSNPEVESPVAGGDNAGGDNAGTGKVTGGEVSAEELAAKPSEREAAVVQGLIDRLKKLADAGDAAARSLESPADKQPAADQQPAADNAAQAAQSGQDAVQAASVGNFQQAADEMREAAESHRETLRQLNDQQNGQPKDADQEQLKSQLEQLADELTRTADIMAGLQKNDAARRAVQQNAQQSTADQAAMLPEKLAEVAERMSLPALGMQQKGQQAARAQQAARQGAESSQQAAAALQAASAAAPQGTEAGRQEQQAADSGTTAAEKLREAAEQARGAAEGASAGADSQPQIPEEVGESVASALQNLSRAGQKQKPDSAETGDSDSDGKQSQEGNGSAEESPSQAEDGLSGQEQNDQEQAGDQQTDSNGSPDSSPPKAQQSSSESDDQNSTAGDEQSESGQSSGSESSGTSGQRSAQQLANAAKRLKQAARRALPRQYTPGQLSDSEEPGEQDPGMAGNDQAWDGAGPQRSARSGTGSRNWSRLQDQLTEELGETGKEYLDPDYADLIQRYRRAVARATAGQDASLEEPAEADAAEVDAAEENSPTASASGADAP